MTTLTEEKIALGPFIKKLQLALKVCTCVGILMQLIGCSTVVPIHEAEAPEVLQGGQFRIGMFGAKSPVIATETLPYSNEAVMFPSEGYKLGFGILDNLQGNLEVMGAGLSVGISGSVKYQWRGDSYFDAKAGNKSQSTVVRTFTSSGIDIETDDDSNIYPYADLTARGFDLTHIFGYRTADWFSIYGGPKYIFGNVRAEYKNLEDGPVVETEKRNFNGYGFIAGFQFSFTGKHIGFDMALEYEGFTLPASYGDKDVWYNGTALSLAIPFGF